jgi:formylglycine-generating enzyme required for sulfatase activity
MERGPRADHEIVIAMRESARRPAAACTDPEDLRNASRHHTTPDNRQYDLGLRLARD